MSTASSRQAVLRITNSPAAQYVDAGNFNYGAVCAAMGHSVEYCQSAAGLALIGRSVSLDTEYMVGQRPSLPCTTCAFGKYARLEAALGNS